LYLTRRDQGKGRTTQCHRKGGGHQGAEKLYLERGIRFQSIEIKNPPSLWLGGFNWVKVFKEEEEREFSLSLRISIHSSH
jgi:hypothetical protein